MRSLIAYIKRGFSPALVVIAVGITSFLTFVPALRNHFLEWDDGVNLTENPYFRGFGRLQLKWMWTNHLLEHYVPLTWMTFGLDWVVWKQNTFGYYLTNIVLHGVDAALLFWLALVFFRLCQPEKDDGSQTPLLWGAAFAALFFSLHPLRVESVAWATERRDMLSTAFYILAVLAYIRRFHRRPGSNLHRSSNGIGSALPYSWQLFFPKK